MIQPRLAKELVKAIYDFAGTDDEDLPFRRGEILEVIEKQEEKVFPQFKFKNNFALLVVAREKRRWKDRNYSSPVRFPLYEECSELRNAEFVSWWLQAAFSQRRRFGQSHHATSAQRLRSPSSSSRCKCSIITLFLNFIFR